MGLVIFLKFYSCASSQASIDLRLTRADAVKMAREFIHSRGFDTKGFDHAVIFDADANASVYMQRTQGMRKANEYIKNGIPIWTWRVRWFKELDKEGFNVFINPSSGKIEHFSHSLLEDAAGVDILKDAAEKIALDELGRHNIKIADYDLKENSTVKRKNRTDHYFVWERKNFKIAQATYRITVSVAGDKLSAYSEYLKIPEDFTRELDKETSSGIIFTTICSMVMFLFTIMAAVVLVLKNHAVNQQIWRVPIILAGCAAFLKMLEFFNELSFNWINYPNTISKPLFIVFQFSDMVHEALVYASVIFCYVLLGLIMCRNQQSRQLPVASKFLKRQLMPADVWAVCARGWSLALIFLGYVTIFYLIVGKFCGVWRPISTQYSNILSTPMPFLFPLTIALIAAVNEEFTYRAFMINFVNHKPGWLWFAVFFSAVIWAFGHSGYAVYPAYVRGIELTIFGVVFGLAFLRYGIEMVIIAHFTVDAILGALPLLRSHSFYFIFSGLVVIGLTVMPAVILYLLRSRKMAV